MSCFLCDIVSGKVKATRYIETEKFIVVRSPTCHVPLAIFKRHVDDVMIWEDEVVIGKIQERFGAGKWRWPRKMLDHWHFHWNAGAPSGIG